MEDRPAPSSPRAHGGVGAGGAAAIFIVTLLLIVSVRTLLPLAGALVFSAVWPASGGLTYALTWSVVTAGFAWSARRLRAAGVVTASVVVIPVVAVILTSVIVPLTGTGAWNESRVRAYFAEHQSDLDALARDWLRAGLYFLACRADDVVPSARPAPGPFENHKSVCTFTTGAGSDRTFFWPVPNDTWFVTGDWNIRINRDSSVDYLPALKVGFDKIASRADVPAERLREWIARLSALNVESISGVYDNPAGVDVVPAGSRCRLTFAAKYEIDAPHRLSAWWTWWEIRHSPI